MSDKIIEKATEVGVSQPIKEKNLLQSPLSVIKMDISELRNYTSRLNDFLSSPGTAAIRICECCINIS